MLVVVDDLLSSRLPSVEPDIREFIRGILIESEDDIASADDVFDAVGEMIKGHSEEELSEADIRTLCHDLHEILKTTNGSCLNGSSSNNLKRLEDHVCLDSTSNNTDDGAFTSMWAKPSTEIVTVNQKKLEKAEAKIKEKQEKRQQQQKSSSPASFVNNNQDCATANQASSRKETKLDAKGQNCSSDVRIENLDLSFGEKQLLAGTDLILAFGRRYGLVGRNGIGKSTLVRALSSGQLRIPSHIRMLHVEQEVAGDETTVLNCVLKAHTRREELLQEERSIHERLAKGADSNAVALSARLAEIYDELAMMGSDKAAAVAGAILFGLGFSPEDQLKPTRQYSGGYRMRISLAIALYTMPDLLLLDEPTNMLDMKAIYWLKGYLQTWPTTLLVVSHDRNFLNDVVTDIIHLHSKRLEAYRGDYDTFERVMSDKLKNQQKEYEAQKLQREHTQKFIDRFRYNANRASTVQSKIKMLEKLPDLEAVQVDSEVTLRFPPCDRLNPPVMQLDDISFFFEPNKPIFNKISLNADMDSRICIVGDNGSGKTTLLKILLGTLSVTGGNRNVHRQLRIGYFTQHFVDQLVMDVSAVELAQSRYPGKPAEFYRAAVGRFGITGDLALQPIQSLSGGQKSRLAFALICLNSPNFLICDEPTNHLDIETVAALGKAINDFEGGVVLVSHDEALIDMVCKELWVVKAGKVRRLEGGLAEYRAIVRKELAAQ